jgi:hypothetical protein
MMGFDANLIEGLNIKGMADYGVPDQTIPEPSNKQFRDFGRFMADMFGGGEESDVFRKYQGTLDAAGDDKQAADAAVDALNDQLFVATSKLCSEVFTAAQLEGLPRRVFGELFLWLITEMASPSKLPAPTSTLRSVGR